MVLLLTGGGGFNVTISALTSLPVWGYYSSAGGDGGDGILLPL